MALTRNLTPHDMGELMAKLATNFGGKKDLEAKSDLWYEKLQYYPLDIVRRVVERLLATETNYFPKIGQAIALAKEMAPDSNRAGPSPRSAMREWETDPWAKVSDLESDKRLCTSAPCPVCGSTVQFSDRGAVVVHDDAMHAEARVSYSNMGNPKWFSMPPPQQLPAPKQKLLPRTPNPYAQPEPAAPLAEIVVEVAG